MTTRGEAMDKRRLKISLFLIAAVFCFIWYAQMLFAQEETLTLKSHYGNVAFPHQPHTKIISCQTCHHNGGGNVGCSVCHSQVSLTYLEKAFHTRCIRCHNMQKKGPTDCLECHKKE